MVRAMTTAEFSERQVEVLRAVAEGKWEVVEVPNFWLNAMVGWKVRPSYAKWGTPVVAEAGEEARWADVLAYGILGVVVGLGAVRNRSAYPGLTGWLGVEEVKGLSGSVKYEVLIRILKVELEMTGEWSEEQRKERARLVKLGAEMVLAAAYVPVWREGRLPAPEKPEGWPKMPPLRWSPGDVSQRQTRGNPEFVWSNRTLWEKMKLKHGLKVGGFLSELPAHLRAQVDAAPAKITPETYRELRDKLRDMPVVRPEARVETALFEEGDVVAREKLLLDLRAADATYFAEREGEGAKARWPVGLEFRLLVEAWSRREEAMQEWTEVRAVRVGEDFQGTLEGEVPWPEMHDGHLARQMTWRLLPRASAEGQGLEQMRVFRTEDGDLKLGGNAVWAEFEGEPGEVTARLEAAGIETLHVMGYDPTQRTVAFKEGVGDVAGDPEGLVDPRELLRQVRATPGCKDAGVLWLEMTGGR